MHGANNVLYVIKRSKKFEYFKTMDVFFEFLEFSKKVTAGAQLVPRASAIAITPGAYCTPERDRMSGILCARAFSSLILGEMLTLVASSDKEIDANRKTGDG